MSANLQPKTPAISAWLKTATTQLIGAGIGSAKLDAEIILAHTLRKNRTYLHAHGDDKLTDRQYEIANARLDLRLDRTPVAYIIGHKEFYGRIFKVTPSTLIPRPESETIIDIVKASIPKNLPLLPETLKLVDVGAGTGCLGITSKLELPELDVTLIDISRHALTIAEANAKQLKASVTLLQSDLLLRYPFKAHYILANLPYIDPAWERSPETNHEPALALFAEDSGLALIKKLIKQAPSHLYPKGHLILEADPRQHPEIISYASQYHFGAVQTKGFIIDLQLD